MNRSSVRTRREFLIDSAGIAAAAVAHSSQAAESSNLKAANSATPILQRRQASIAITLDLEMARNFPRWEDAHWDYEKGLLNAEAKAYAVEAARRVRARGGMIHFFVVGRVFEQDDIEWLKQLHRLGHPIGNHTYDHVYVLATKPEDIQYRFKRAPWLIRGKTPSQVIRENIELCSEAMEARMGMKPAGFRTPGGFSEGLNGRPDVQNTLLNLGFRWVSCKYPAHPYSQPGTPPTAEVLEGIVAAQAAAQPFVYPNGLVDVPMSPISDVGAFRNCRWKLGDFLTAVKLGVEWAIEHQAVYDFLAHPSVLYPNDPEFQTIEMICDLVQKAGNRARLTDLDAIARDVAL